MPLNPMTVAQRGCVMALHLSLGEGRTLRLHGWGSLGDCSGQIFFVLMGCVVSVGGVGCFVLNGELGKGKAVYHV